jgi:hypothetical protein
MSAIPAAEHLLSASFLHLRRYLAGIASQWPVIHGIETSIYSEVLSQMVTRMVQPNMLAVAYQIRLPSGSRGSAWDARLSAGQPIPDFNMRTK